MSTSQPDSEQGGKQQEQEKEESQQMPSPLPSSNTTTSQEEYPAAITVKIRMSTMTPLPSIYSAAPSPSSLSSTGPCPTSVSLLSSSANQDAAASANTASLNVLPSRKKDQTASTENGAGGDASGATTAGAGNAAVSMPSSSSSSSSSSKKSTTGSGNSRQSGKGTGGSSGNGGSGGRQSGGGKKTPSKKSKAGQQSQGQSSASSSNPTAAGGGHEKTSAKSSASNSESLVSSSPDTTGLTGPGTGTTAVSSTGSSETSTLASTSAADTANNNALSSSVPMATSSRGRPRKSHQYHNLNKGDRSMSEEIIEASASSVSLLLPSSDSSANNTGPPTPTKQRGRPRASADANSSANSKDATFRTPSNASANSVATTSGKTSPSNEHSMTDANDSSNEEGSSPADHRKTQTSSELASSVTSPLSSQDEPFRGEAERAEEQQSDTDAAQPDAEADPIAASNTIAEPSILSPSPSQESATAEILEDEPSSTPSTGDGTQSASASLSSPKELKSGGRWRSKKSSPSSSDSKESSALSSSQSTKGSLPGSTQLKSEDSGVSSGASSKSTAPAKAKKTTKDVSASSKEVNKKDDNDSKVTGAKLTGSRKRVFTSSKEKTKAPKTGEANEREEQDVANLTDTYGVKKAKTKKNDTGNEETASSDRDMTDPPTDSAADAAVRDPRTSGNDDVEDEKMGGMEINEDSRDHISSESKEDDDEEDDDDNDDDDDDDDVVGGGSRDDDDDEHLDGKDDDGKSGEGTVDGDDMDDDGEDEYEQVFVGDGGIKGHPYLGKRCRVVSGQFSGLSGKIVHIASRGWWTIDNPSIRGRKVHSRLCEMIDYVDDSLMVKFYAKKGIKMKRPPSVKMARKPSRSASSSSGSSARNTPTALPPDDHWTSVDTKGEVEAEDSRHEEEEDDSEQVAKKRPRSDASLDEEDDEPSRRSRPKRAAAAIMPSYTATVIHTPLDLGSRARRPSSSASTSPGVARGAGSGTDGAGPEDRTSSDRPVARKLSTQVEASKVTPKASSVSTGGSRSKPSSSGRSSFPRDHSSSGTPPQARYRQQRPHEIGTHAPVVLESVDNDMEIPRACRHLDPDDKIEIFDRKTGRILRGENAIPVRNLAAILRMHAEYEPIVPPPKDPAYGLDLPREGRSSDAVRVNAAVDPQNKIRASCVEGRSVVVKGGQYRGLIGKIEACFPGGWYLVSNLFEEDDLDLDVVIRSSDLELIPDKVPDPMTLGEGAATAARANASASDIAAQKEKEAVDAIESLLSRTFRMPLRSLRQKIDALREEKEAITNALHQEESEYRPSDRDSDARESRVVEQDDDEKMPPVTDGESRGKDDAPSSGKPGPAMSSSAGSTDGTRGLRVYRFRRQLERVQQRLEQEERELEAMIAAVHRVRSRTEGIFEQCCSNESSSL